MLVNQLRDDVARSGLGLFDRDTRLESGHRSIRVPDAITAHGWIVWHCERSPDVCARGELLPRRHLQPARKLKTLWHHAEHLVVLVVEPQHLVDYLCIAACDSLPEVITEHDDV